jgi:Na+/melibiose symporter-like transporter
MEFSVAIAGFSGISIAIQSRDAKADAIREFRNKNLIMWSLCAAFGSTLPEGVVYLGAEGPQVWSWSSYLYALFLFSVLSVPYASRSRLTPDERARLSSLIWVLGVGGTALVAVAQVVNGLGWLHSPSAAPLYWGVLWMILFAAMQFYRNLFGPR